MYKVAEPLEFVKCQERLKIVKCAFKTLLSTSPPQFARYNWCRSPIADWCKSSTNSMLIIWQCWSSGSSFPHRLSGSSFPHLASISSFPHRLFVLQKQHEFYVDHLAALSHTGYPIWCKFGLLCTLIDQPRGNDSIILRFFRCPGVFAIGMISFSSLKFLTFAK